MRDGSGCEGEGGVKESTFHVLLAVLIDFGVCALVVLGLFRGEAVDPVIFLMNVTAAVARVMMSHVTPDIHSASVWFIQTHTSASGRLEA